MLSFCVLPFLALVPRAYAQGTPPAAGTATSTATDTIDIYLSKADSTPVREKVSLHISKPTIHVVTENFSQYGEALHVTVPAACSK
jgi:hypothetical protein